MDKKLAVIELFAGVGGFRLGLEGWQGFSALSGYKTKIKSKFEVVWSNQWEPSTKAQPASDVYVKRWGGKNHSNQDISKVQTSDIPDHDLLVGGFPCQDYSVARVLSHSKGLVGKKGVLWWEIHRILKEKGDKKPKYLILENVDRLISSPAKQKGRDFALMLSSLTDLGYAVEWRIINAADYGLPQRRKRVFIVGYLKGTPSYKEIEKDRMDWVTSTGIMAKAFNLGEPSNISSFKIQGELDEISDSFNKLGNRSPFLTCGLILDRDVITLKSKSVYDGKKLTIRDVLESGQISSDYYLKDTEIAKWQYYKGPKREQRKNRAGQLFNYSEGGLSFPDSVDSPSRTIITSEGGKTPSRTTHVIKDEIGFRRLTPIELERLNMFPDNHTEGASDNKRAFFMGNALVVGVIEKIGISLTNHI
jgi:DNA (cytosine-5)-methyltransferase 1